MKIGIVIPHHLATLDFLEEWREEFSKRDVFLYIIEDKDNRETSVPEWLNNFTIITHRDIKDCLDKKSWIIPFKTSAIRSFGYYMAWADNCDYILTLDNDCYPENENYWILGHIENLQSKVTLDWVSSLPDSDLETRGFPYMIRDKSPIGVSHGLWSNVPDFDGIDMLKYPEKRFKAELKSKLIPRYSFYPMCGMNLAFTREMAPLMYFGLQGPSWGFDQYDDIFGGIFSKKVMDHLGYGVISGYPSVEHRKQSNAFINLKKQVPGLLLNEHLWKEVQKIKLTKKTPVECYIELAQKLPNTVEGDVDGWLLKQKEAMLIWAKLFVEK